MNNLVHTLVCSNVEERICRREIVGSKGIPISNFDRSCQVAPQKSCTNFMLPPSMRVPISDGEGFDARNYTLKVSKMLPSAQECNSVNPVFRFLL